MSLRTQLMLIVALVALAAVTVTALLSVQVASQRVARLLDEAPPAESVQVPAGSHPKPGARHAALERDLRRANVEAAAIALLVAAAAGLPLATRLSRPLRGLTSVANRYAAGERSARASERGRDEVAGVAKAFNHMADRLQREEEQQQRLIADIAHELRTPLTVLKGELEALEDGLVLGEPATYRRLGEEVTLLERLVQDLRLLTQAETGELTLHTRPVDLAALAAEVTASFSLRAAKKQVTLHADLVPTTVEGDPDRLRQVLVNLLENAARYAPVGSQLDVGLRRGAEHATLTVRDRGPGIPEEERESVFQRFYRLDRARRRTTGGTGLGLAIVRSLVLLHGGRVAASSHPEGGAVLTVTLPLSAGIPRG